MKDRDASRFPAYVSYHKGCHFQMVEMVRATSNEDVHCSHSMGVLSDNIARTKNFKKTPDSYSAERDFGLANETINSSRYTHGQKAVLLTEYSVLSCEAFKSG